MGVAGEPKSARRNGLATRALADAAGRKANEDELDRLLAEATKNAERYDLMHRLQQRGVPAAAVQKADDRCERDPQLKARGYFVPLPHSEIGTWPIEGFPAKFERFPPMSAACRIAARR